MRTKPFNNEVVYPDEPIVRVDRALIDHLKLGALANERQRMRLCAHREVEDSLHEMLIVHTSDTYVRPHKHINKSESFHVIEGLVDILLFDEQGEVTDVIQMGDFNTGRHFYYRIDSPILHTLLIRSDIIVFHEATGGPFNRADTAFPSWAPDGSDPALTDKFVRKLDSQCRGLLARRRDGSL